MKTDIINETYQSFELKEGNAGAYRFLQQLKARGKFPIKVDPNATYREYVVATGKKGESIFLTSDDFSEYKVINIKEEIQGGTKIYKSVPSKPRKPGLSRASEPSAKSKIQGGSDVGLGSVPSVSSGVGGRSDPPAPSAPGVGSDPPAPSAPGVGSDPPAPSAPGVGLDPLALSVASSRPALGISNQNDRVPWYRKKKSWFK